jgi:hypothetical protein
MEHMLIKLTKEVSFGIIIEETSYCNKSSKSEGISL